MRGAAVKVIVIRTGFRRAGPEVARHVVEVGMTAEAAAQTDDLHHQHNQEAARSDRHENKTLHQLVVLLLHRLRDGVALARHIYKKIGGEAHHHDAARKGKKRENNAYHTKRGAIAGVDPAGHEHAGQATEASTRHRQRGGGDVVVLLRFAAVVTGVDTLDGGGDRIHMARLRVPVVDRFLCRRVAYL